LTYKRAIPVYTSSTNEPNYEIFPLLTPTAPSVSMRMRMRIMFLMMMMMITYVPFHLLYISGLALISTKLE
jgi:hypothetical protein